MISNPYLLTDDEKKLISDYFTSHDDWYKPIFDALKENIREHMRIEQNNKCCYCQKNLGTDLKEVDIEHIIPKSEIKDFTFHTKNLAISCPACNTIKHDKSIFIKPLKIKTYPKNSKNIKIVHPHFDEYNNNIEIINESIYAAKTAKGSETITMCELYRLRIVIEKAKQYRAKTSLIADMVEEIRKGGDSINEFSSFISSLLNNRK